MTQPQEAVGGANDEPIIAAEPTLEDRFAAISEQEEEKPEEGAEQPEGAEPELTEEDVIEAEAEDEKDLQPIQPPVSWTGENKEKFAQLPRDVQEYIAQRETEREKFVQTKAQEAKQVETRVQAQAREALSGLQTHYTQQLNSLLVQVPAKPSYQLQAEDPYAFAEQMDAHELAAAHNQWIEQRVGVVRYQEQQAQQAHRQRAAQEMQAVLSTEFPEFLDPVKGTELRQKLGSTASELGYSAEQIADADHHDILAMKKAHEWREDSLKYRALMAKKMEKVRQAKDMPRVSRPGTAQGPGVAANQRYTADRQAMRQGDKDAAARVFGKFL